MVQKNRNIIFDYNNLSVLGKVSLWFGKRIILSSLVSGRWLDVLCGYRSLLQVSQSGNNKMKFYSLDFKLDPLLIEKNINAKEIKLADKLPFDNMYFENVTIINGLEHLVEDHKILVESFRIMRNKGVLQIIVPTWFGKRFLEYYAFKIGNEQAKIEMDDHKMYYDEKTLWPMLIKAGFKPHNIQIKKIKFGCSLYAKATKE